MLAAMTGPVQGLARRLGAIAPAVAVAIALSPSACRPRQPKPAPAAPTKPAAEIAVVPADAIRSPSGLASKVLQPGEGDAHPTLRDSVTVFYTGWTAEGRMFNSSGDQPVTFPMTQLIPGWIEGMAGMVRREKRRFWIPSRLAYGDSSTNPTAPAGDLVFDIQLLAIQQGSGPPAVPPDLTPVPRDVKRTRSGLAYRILSHGTGTRHPSAASTVQVHYTGWQTNGRMYNTSTTRNEPTSLALATTQPGWRESVLLMVVGDKGRFWIPNRLLSPGPANSAGPVPGMLVFDIELLGIR